MPDEKKESAVAFLEVKPGDRVSFPAGPYIRTVEVLDLGTRQGPAPEAQGLYRDLERELASDE